MRRRIPPSLPRRVRRRHLIIQTPFPIPTSTIFSARQVCELELANMTGFEHPCPLLLHQNANPPNILVPTTPTTTPISTFTRVERPTSSSAVNWHVCLVDVMSAVQLNVTPMDYSLERGMSWCVYFRNLAGLVGWLYFVEFLVSVHLVRTVLEVRAIALLTTGQVALWLTFQSYPWGTDLPPRLWGG